MPANDIEILYRDAHLVAVFKPAGLLVHRSSIDRHETRFALQMVRDRIGRRVHPVHRLDKPTAGVLLFALDPDTAHRMMTRFAAGAVRKRYLAVVRGHVDEHATIDYPLVEQADRAADARAEPDKAPQPAVTRYRRFATTERPDAVGRYPTARYSLIEAMPQTGRQHQIRRHLKHVFHPVVGDTTHGDGHHNRYFRSRFGCHRLMLTATELAFAHPHGDAPVVVRAAPDAAFAAVLEALGWGGVETTGGEPGASRV